MRKEWLLLSVSVLVTLALALGLIRWLAPGLLGMAPPVDLQLVQIDAKLPPFYESMLGPEVLNPETPDILQDPLTGTRHRTMLPFNYGPVTPFDALGFRNLAVPVTADIVTIGDSQTVSINAPYQRTLPAQLVARLGAKQPSYYNMAKDGWGAVQYLYMAEKAMAFRPRVLVVAYYTGNDPVESLIHAYSSEAWKSLRAHETQPQMAPSAWPPKPEESWPATFPDGSRTIFTPKTRMTSNDRNYPGTTEGYRIMAESARRIAGIANRHGVAVVFTIIPTKELVYAPKVERDRQPPTEDYRGLVADQARNVAELAKALSGIRGAAYVDVVAPLQQAAMGPVALYPGGPDGHPLATGYEVITGVLAPAVDRALPQPLGDGAYRLESGAPEGVAPYVLVRDGYLLWFAVEGLVTANGWPTPKSLPQATMRDLARFMPLGGVSEVNRRMFGPRTAGGR